MANVLGITARHLGYLPSNLHLLAAPLLPAFLACSADRQPQEPSAFFEVEVCARFGDARELVMNVLPIDIGIHELH